MNKPRHQFEHWMIIAFSLVIFLGSALYLIWSRETSSESEKRRLAQFPELSISSWFTGELQSGIDRFYADQLPMREPLIRLDQRVEHGTSTWFGLRRTQLIEGGQLDLGEGENVGFEEEDLIHFTEPTTVATSEAEAVTETTTETSKSQTSESQTTGTSSVSPSETSTSTQSEMAAETTTESTDPVVDQNLGAVLIIGDQALETFGYIPGYVTRYAEEMNRLQDVSGEAKVYNLIAPTANEFYAPSAYRTGSASQKQMILEVNEVLDPAISTVDAYTPLSRHTDEYIWFRTDHHWTGLGAYYAYTAFCETAGLTPVPLEEMEHGEVPGTFLGSLYNYSNQSPQLAENPDTVEYWLPEVESEGYTFTDATMTAGWEIELVDRDFDLGNKYMAFTQGDHGRAQFKTDVANGRTLLVLKESYGNAVVPYLASHYETIYIIDPRRIDLSLETFIAGMGVDDVLVVNYASAIGNPSWNNGFRDLLGLPHWN